MIVHYFYLSVALILFHLEFRIIFALLSEKIQVFLHSNSALLCSGHRTFSRVLGVVGSQSCVLTSAFIWIIVET